jgi:hypothetical protein
MGGARVGRTGGVAAAVGSALLFALWVCSPAVQAQEHSANELAKQLSNPVADLISVPIQLNWDTDLGPDEEGERFVLNVQPVIPVSLGEHWNMISRTILPIIDQSDVFPGDDSQSGIGDITQSLFFSPKKTTSGGWIWGAGPAFLIPTASDDLLGTEKWGIGPTAVVLKQDGALTYGGLINHIESVAGDDERADVSSTFLQPFIAQALGKGATFSLNLESSYDWEGEQWTVPVNIVYTQVVPIGKLPVSIGAGARYYVEAPDNGPKWGLRIVFTLLFPK